MLLPAGLWLVAGLPVPVPARVFLALAWCADLLWQVGRLYRHGRGLVAIRADAGGGLAGCGPAGDEFPLRLLPGSIFAARFVWLRLRLPDGGRHAELVLSRHAEASAWHRFQLVGRLAGYAVGHPDQP